MSSSTTTTTKTEIPEPSKEEKAIMEMVSGALMPAYLEETGYDVTKIEKGWEQSADYKGFRDQRNRLNKELKEAEKQLAEFDKNNKGGGGYNRYGGYNNPRQDYLNKISKINEKMDKLDGEEKKARDAFEPEVTYDVRKMDSPEVEYIRNKYGEHSSKYKKAKEAYEKEKIDIDKKQKDLQKTFMEKAQKYLNGDFSISDEQRQLISENMAPVREAVTKMFDSALAEAEKTADTTRGEVMATHDKLLATTQKTFDEFEARVKETGMSVSNALDVVGSQIRETGMEMEDALKNTIAAHKELLELGIEDYTGQVTKSVAMNAAALGRSPDDPEYKLEVAEKIAREVKSGQLNLAAMETQGMVAIKERTGGGLEDVARQKAGVTERTGMALEESAMGRGQQELSIEERTGQAREAIARELGMTRMEIARGRGAAETGIAESEANLRWQVGAGMPPQQIGVAQGVHQYNEALAQQRIANAGNAMNAPMPLINYYQQERMAQPTTTQTVRQSMGFGGIMSGILGAASAGASIYSGISSANFLGDIAKKW